MVKAGAVLIVGSILALLGYAAYYLFQALFVAAGVSLIIRLAVPAALVGFVLLVLAVVRDRLRAQRGEHFKEVEH